MGSDDNKVDAVTQVVISIHAPRMGSDFSGFFIWFVGINFNPRSPDGERRGVARHVHRGAGHFNPRSPDGERRGVARHVHRGAGHFNPRSPDGERP